jgi:hypothetical protein
MTTADRHAKRRHEAPELGSASKRFMRALVRRAGEGDTEALEALVGLQAVLQEAITDAGRVLHDEADYSYTELANVLGISRQGARQRFAPKPVAVDEAAGLATLLDEVPA